MEANDLNCFINFIERSSLERMRQLNVKFFCHFISQVKYFTFRAMSFAAVLLKSLSNVLLNLLYHAILLMKILLEDLNDTY